MSGYRNLHREQVLFSETKEDGGDSNGGAAIWSLCTAPLFSDLSSPTTSTTTKSSVSSLLSSHWRVWMACSDSTIRGYRVFEKNNNNNNAEMTATTTTSSTAEKIKPKKDDDDGGDNGGDSKEKEEESEESSSSQEEELSASAVQLQYTHCLSAATGDDSNSSVGCTALSSICVPQAANDDCNNNMLLVLAAMDLTGTLRVWPVPVDDDDSTMDATIALQQKPPNEPQPIQSSVNIQVPNATGTTALLVPLQSTSSDPLGRVVLVAVGCLDGTIALVSTGISTLRGGESAATFPPAGNIVQVWGSNETSEEEEELAVPMAMVWQPKKATIKTAAESSESTRTLAVGRFDGHVDVYTTASSSLSLVEAPPPQCSRLDTLQGSPVRAVTYTTDGHLLIAGNDQGNLCLWDCSSCSCMSGKPPVLRHHFYQAHASWILQATALDERSFLTLGADCRVHVWNVGQMDHAHPVHTFTASFFSTGSTTSTESTTTALANKNKSTSQEQEDATMEGGEEKKDTSLPEPPPTPPMLWSMARGPPSTARFITGSDHGWLQIYSLE